MKETTRTTTKQRQKSKTPQPEYTFLLAAFVDHRCVEIRTIVTEHYIWPDWNLAIINKAVAAIKQHWRRHHPDQPLDYIYLYQVDTRERAWEKWKFLQPLSFNSIWERDGYVHDDPQGNLDSGA